MSRPTDWWVLDLDGDPTPGSPSAIAAMARTWARLADDCDEAETRVRGLLGDGAVASWIGEAGEAFRSKTSDLPDQLGKATSSYRMASDALTRWSGQLSTHQDQADRALVLGRAAREDLEAARARATSAAAAVDSASGVSVLTDPSLQPTRDQISSANARLSAARNASSSAAGEVEAAQSRLDAARQMALDAASLREGDGRRTAGEIDEASDAGIPERSRWEKFKEWAGEAWDVIVTIAKVVVAVLSIVVLIIGGPLAWVLLAAALLVLADAIMKYANGEGSLWEVGLAALGCIPGTKGLTTLAALRSAFRSGGTLAAAAHVASQGRVALTQMAASVRSFGPNLVTRVRGLGENGLSLRSLVTFGRGRAVPDLPPTGTPAGEAARWQGSGAYPGIDDWADDVLPPGTIVEAGWPGTSGFTVPEGTIASVGNDAGRLADGTQVAPNFDYSPPLRSEAMTFRMEADVPAATSVTSANPQHGAGGLTQHYVPEFNQLVADGQISAVDGAGNIVPAGLNENGGLVLDLPDGPTIHMTNPHPLPNLGGNDYVSAGQIPTRVGGAVDAVRER